MKRLLIWNARRLSRKLALDLISGDQAGVRWSAGVFFEAR
jgi:hypothetical protein